MNQQNLPPIEFLKPAFLDSEQRYNNYFFTIGFELNGRFAMAKFSVTEGTLRGQTTKHCLSRGGLVLREEDDASVLLGAEQDLNLKEYYEDITVSHDAQQVSVKMGQTAMTCRPDCNKLFSDHPALGAELTFTPRGPVHEFKAWRFRPLRRVRWWWMGNLSKSMEPVFLNMSGSMNMSICKFVS